MRSSSPPSLQRSLFFLLFALGALIAACSAPREGWRDAPVILISIDTLRADRLPAYGYDALSTPAIEGLARDGVVFRQAFSHVPLTLPSHLSIFTGLLPHRHGVRANVGYSVELGDVPDLAGLLKSHGYATGAAVSALPLARRSGFGAGFDHFDDADGFAGLPVFQRAGLESLQASLPWLRARADDEKPFFFFFHIFEPHQSLIPDAAFTDGGSTYDAEVVHADHVIGALLNELRRLGVYDKAVVVLLSDHGEGLGDHGETEHGMLLYREALHVPWMLKLPNNAEAGRAVQEPVGLTDVLPTLLDLLGLPVPQDLDGRSRRPWILGAETEQLPPPRPILAETLYPRLEMGWSELYSALGNGFHLIDGPKPELYDMAQDPDEQHPLPLENLAGEPRRALGELRNALEESDASFVEAAAISDESTAALASLGYIGTSSAPEDPSISPRDRIAVYEDYRHGQKAVLDENWTAAEQRLKKVLAQDASLLDAWLLLGTALDHLGRPQEALDAYLIGGPRSDRAVEIAATVAGLCTRLGRERDCPSWLRAFVAAEPTEPRLLFLTAQSLRRTERYDEALETAEEALALAPNDPDAIYLRGTVSAALGRRDEALADLRRAVTMSGEKHLPAMVDLAVLLYDQGTLEDQEESRRLLGLARFEAPEDPSVQAALKHIGLE